ncbi:flagellar protein [Paenibacillus mesophilus]|uniref:flagellar biosynthetic protein FliO n=1 Tax=Paenibacillus mesophilus TaxID=2582849 RepID=UPI00110F12C1|nr:flagellar biosynthetic protein FliO [Paenibacillus mesophilus]TMV52043.1 flagellar protein [Paenibacillus mesophilus]
MARNAGGRLKLLRHSMMLAAFAVLSLSAPWNAATVAYAEGDAAGGAFQAGSGSSTAIPGSSGAVFIAMVKVIFFLILIIGIFLIIMKALSKKKWSWNSGRAVKALGGLPLGQNKSVQIVEIGRSIYILGVGDGVQLIQKIDDPEEIAYITAFLNPDSANAGQSWQGIREWLGGMKKREREPVEDENDVAASFQDVFQSKMKHMTGRKQLIEDMLRSDDKTNRKVDP